MKAFVKYLDQQTNEDFRFKLAEAAGEVTEGNRKYIQFFPTLNADKGKKG